MALQFKEAIKGQDIVYANLAGDLEAMAKNIVKAMQEEGVQKLIFISSIEIYKEPVRPVLKPYRKAADVVEASGLEYTILRPTWFTSVDEVDYEITRKGEPVTIYNTSVRFKPVKPVKAISLLRRSGKPVNFKIQTCTYSSLLMPSKIVLLLKKQQQPFRKDFYKVSWIVSVNVFL
ncbi:NAD(P)H-binding protein [Chitinophagaceae bacterium LB-8]|jgi:putative NAD(P)-binding protein|uniref:NAD(P)H-binding protein n=1 Tax=Paraflavisolibacter caeni TaxID=2982496 RepID=A0A9X2XWC1_9BACT|nr:NAD(P)H-binding protein [Paraflavisolibacter caeni]MCU7549692.1 NAD(P)H-binding protein [Paraflavisolibacter caeni]